MGVVANIKHDEFPKQSAMAGRRVMVCFHNDLEHKLGGVIVRADAEDPHRTVIRLDDGRHVLATECQYRPLPEEEWQEIL